MRFCGAWSNVGRRVKQEASFMGWRRGLGDRVSVGVFVVVFFSVTFLWMSGPAAKGRVPLKEDLWR